MKVWLKRQGHRVGGKLPGAHRVVNGHSAWQQGGGVGTALQGSGEVTEEPCGCEQAVAPLANHAVGEVVPLSSTAERDACECEQEGGAGNGDAVVRRIGGCGANEAQGIPDNAAEVIRRADSKATFFLSLAKMSTFLISQLIKTDADYSSNPTLLAYLSRFDGPERVGNRYRSRFGGTTFATEKEAQSSELSELDRRIGRMEQHLSAGINYRCNPRGTLRVGACTDRCRDNWALWTCHLGTRDIAVCPPFFNGNGVNDDSRALGVIHELGHNKLRLSGHNAGDRRQRAANPECYASYIGDIRSVLSFDSRCPPL